MKNLKNILAVFGVLVLVALLIAASQPTMGTTELVKANGGSSTNQTVRSPVGSSTALTVNTNALKVVGTNVGVGTADPAANLDVPGTAAIGTLRATNVIPLIQTNYAAASSVILNANTHVSADVTNAIGTAVSVLVTNPLVGASGSFKIKSDASARTISLFSGHLLTPMSTNATVNSTNLITTVSKDLLICWSVRQGTATQTQILYWAVAAP